MWLLFMLVSIAPVMSPGPGILFAITNALRYGPGVTIIVGVVNGTGIALLGLAVGFGLGALMAASMMAFVILKLVGAAYLVWLGVRIWRDRSAFLLDKTAHVGPAPLRSLMSNALAISLTNPKAIIALTALFPPFLNDASALGPQVWILSLSYGGLCIANHVLIAYAGGWLRQFLQSPDRARLLRRVTGGAFIAFGSLLAASSRA